MSEEEQKEDVLNYMRDCPKKRPKIWYFTHASALEYAVVLADTEEEAFEKLKDRRKESYFDAQEWNVEEFTEDKYSGVLYFS